MSDMRLLIKGETYVLMETCAKDHSMSTKATASDAV